MNRIVKPLENNILDQRQALIKQLNPIEFKIEERFNYILHKLNEVCGATFSSWYVDGAEEGEVGNIYSLFHGNSIYLDDVIFYNMRKSKEYSAMAIIGIGEEDLSRAIPQRWLFEDFETELEDGRRKYQDKQLLAKIRSKEAKLAEKRKRDEIIKGAKEKLSPEEQKALGL